MVCPLQREFYSFVELHRKRKPQQGSRSFRFESIQMMARFGNIKPGSIVE